MRLPSSLISALAAAVAVCGQDLTEDTIARDISRVEAVRQVKDVTRGFAHLLQYGRFAEAARLFAPGTGTLLWGAAVRKDDAAIVAAAPGAAGSARKAVGPEAVEAWLRNDAGAMTGASPGSMNLWIIETPVVTLSADGKAAKGRWNALRFMGDGKGGTRIDGGVWENDYVLVGNDTWRFATLHHYEMFKGNWVQGWRNSAPLSGGDRVSLPIVPYHFTPDDAGIPIMLPLSREAYNQSGAAELKSIKAELVARVELLNDEDEVRNLQHMMGYYIDRRMWPDAVDLFAPDGVIVVDGQTLATGAGSVRAAFERLWGPEGLSSGILNEHPMLVTMVDVLSPTEAATRGFQIGMIGNSNTKTAKWEFATYRNSFAKDPDTGLWCVKAVNITNVLTADYALGWGNGGTDPASTTRAPPAFIDIDRRARNAARIAQRLAPKTEEQLVPVNLAELQRRLSRSAAWDSTENDCSAYGFWADDIRCDKLGAIHAAAGHKESPGSGYFGTADRIARACLARYSTYDQDPMRGSVPFHWKPQMVVRVSHDGRSATYRARLLQFGTGTTGGSAFGGGMYADQTVLETGSGKWKLWSTTIDEFYWNSGNWASGWAGVVRPNSTGQSSPSSARPSTTTRRTSTTTRPAATGASSRPSSSSRPPSGLAAFPPEVPLTNPLFVPREDGFSGGAPPRVSWPNIQTMWFPFRNPVSGTIPGANTSTILLVNGTAKVTAVKKGGEGFWPGCVPCQSWGPRPEWALRANGYQEPPTGPTRITATAEVKAVPNPEPGTGKMDPMLVVSVAVKVAGGPGEEVGRGGIVELTVENDGQVSTASNPAKLLASREVDPATGAMKAFEMGITEWWNTTGADNGPVRIVALFKGSDRLAEGRGSVVLDLPS